MRTDRVYLEGDEGADNNINISVEIDTGDMEFPIILGIENARDDRIGAALSETEILKLIAMLFQHMQILKNNRV